jgi:CDP-diacylglycerol--glycerol-3-phosphate 3-phosphatidyltransferase
MNIPNILTALRIACIPALVIVLLTPFQKNNIVAFSIFLLASVTDMLDGFWARRKKLITVSGQLLDPLADKLLIASALICLVELGIVKAWMVIIIIAREIAVTGFRALASSKGYNIPASTLGKIKMVLETTTILLLLLGKEILGKLYFFSQLGLWLIIATAIFSAIEYYFKYGHLVLSQRSS